MLALCQDELGLSPEPGAYSQCGLDKLLNLSLNSSL